MTWTHALTELREALEELYNSSDAIGIVLDEARIPRAQIHIHVAPTLAWHAALTEAARLNRVVDLITVARQQYPTNARLSGAGDQYIRSLGVATTQSDTINAAIVADAEGHSHSVGHAIELPKPSMTIGALSVGSVNPSFGATGCFYISVRNGPVSLWPTLKMTDFSDEALNETPFIAHWRGLISPHYLSVWDPQQFGLLGIAASPGRNPALFVWAQDNIRIPVTRDLPLERQEPIEFVVTFYGRYTVVARRIGELNHEDEKVLAKRKYRVAPDTNCQAQFKYKVVSEEVLSI